MKKYILFLLVWYSFLAAYSQQIIVISSKEGRESSIQFIDISNNVIDELLLSEFNPWNKLPYKKAERDSEGNYRYSISKSELKELFKHECNAGLYDTSAINANDEYVIHSEVYTSIPNKSNIVIAFNLIGDIANTDLTLIAKSYIVILDNKKNILFENKDHSFINSSIVVSNNAEFLAYKTGIMFSEDSELIPEGFEIFSVIKNVPVFYEQGSFNIVLPEDKLNLIRASILKDNGTYIDLYFNPQKKIIFINEYKAESDKILIDITEEGLIYLLPGRTELVTFESMKKLIL